MIQSGKNANSGRLSAMVALVTGASRGIGRGIALCMAREGADVVINYRSHLDEAQSLADEIEKLGRRTLICQADVSDRQAVEKMFEAALEHFGSLDIAVANAAMSIRENVTDASWEGFRKTIEVVQFGAFHTCQLAARQMIKQGPRGGESAGKIIIIGSVHDDLTMPSCAAYNMSKAAISQLARTMSVELAPYRININVINPGWTDTPGERNFYTEEELMEGGKKLPWGRLGTVEDIGKSAGFLASEDASYISGATLRVDGALVPSAAPDLRN